MIVWGMLNVSGVSFAKPETTSQTACSLLIVMCCIATNAIIIGSVTTAITQMNAYHNEESLKRRAITTYLRSHQVPHQLEQNVQKFYDFIGGVAFRKLDDMAPNLPRGITFELDLFMKRDVFLKVPFFADLSVPQIMALVPKVTLEDLMPGHTIVREGIVSESMFMISRGKVHIFVKGSMVAVRVHGEYVGERSLVTNAPAKATCITADWTTLMVLRRRAFKELCVAFPMLMKRLELEMRAKDKKMKVEEKSMRDLNSLDENDKSMKRSASKRTTRQATGALSA